MPRTVTTKRIAVDEMIGSVPRVVMTVDGDLVQEKREEKEAGQLSGEIGIEMEEGIGMGTGADEIRGERRGVEVEVGVGIDIGIREVSISLASFTRALLMEYR
jgi:hypothetical protein